MPLSNIDYAGRAMSAGLNILSVAERDIAHNTRKIVVNSANPTNNCYSVAKAYTVLAVGMARDRGLLSTSDKVADLLGGLPEYADPAWREVTLDNLLVHKAGFGAGLLDIDASPASEFPSRDYLSVVLSASLPNKPGEVRQYTDASYYLISRVISRVCGMTLADFLRPALMGTMDFDEYAWSACPGGYTMGATGLYLRTEDMVKLGTLWLLGGVWRGARVVSQEWCDTVLEREYEFHPVADGWIGKGGMRGQMLCFNTRAGLAVAWQAFERKVPFEAMLG